jgi:hypothetical protein
MFGKVALVLSVCAAILQLPAALPAPPCCATPDAQHAVLADGCCAAMACCVISDATARQPITPTPVTNNIVALRRSSAAGGPLTTASRASLHALDLIRGV